MSAFGCVHEGGACRIWGAPGPCGARDRPRTLAPHAGIFSSHFFYPQEFRSREAVSGSCTDRVGQYFAIQVSHLACTRTHPSCVKATTSIGMSELFRFRQSMCPDRYESVPGPCGACNRPTLAPHAVQNNPCLRHVHRGAKSRSTLNLRHATFWKRRVVGEMFVAQTSCFIAHRAGNCIVDWIPSPSLRQSTLCRSSGERGLGRGVHA